MSLEHDSVVICVLYARSELGDGRKDAPRGAGRGFDYDFDSCRAFGFRAGRILPPRADLTPDRSLGVARGGSGLVGTWMSTGPVSNGSRQRTQSAIPFHTRHSISQVASVSNLSNQPTPREPSERNRVRSRRGTRQSNTHPIKHHISRQGHLTPRYARAHTAARRPNGAVRLWPVYMPLCALIIWMALTPMRSVSSHAS